MVIHASGLHSPLHAQQIENVSLVGESNALFSKYGRTQTSRALQENGSLSITVVAGGDGGRAALAERPRQAYWRLFTLIANSTESADGSCIGRIRPVVLPQKRSVDQRDRHSCYRPRCAACPKVFPAKIQHLHPRVTGSPHRTRLRTRRNSTRVLGRD